MGGTWRKDAMLSIQVNVEALVMTGVPSQRLPALRADPVLGYGRAITSTVHTLGLVILAPKLARLLESLQSCRKGSFHLTRVFGVLIYVPSTMADADAFHAVT